MKKWISLFLIALLIIPLNTYASTDTKPKVLVLYDTEDGQITSDIRILDNTLGHFTNDITMMDEQKISDPSSLSHYTHVVYIGTKKTVLTDATKDFIEHFPGPVLCLGSNIEQLTNRFSFIQPKNEDVVVDTITYPSIQQQKELDAEKLVNHVETTGEILSYGTGKGISYPLIMKQEQSYYVATSNLLDWTSNYVGEMLFSYFGQQPKTDDTLAYLRLEDVHPAADPDQLKEIGEYLKEKEIPYMITLIPVYKDPKTGETIHLKDKPELVDVLRYMQDNGASIVLHGYTHQFYDSETGEGFEFWDVKTDNPIRQPNDKEPKTRGDFPSDEAYEAYIQKGEEFEEAYIREHIEKGIEEAVEARLYPVAFEAPHYTMSQKGYEILSEYFTTYVGQLQLSDETWTGMHSPIFTSEPSFLHGMKLLPETIGFVEPGKPNQIAHMKEMAVQSAALSDGMIGAFYHPYLGVDQLKQLVEELESIPNIKWIDLKTENNEVKAGDIHITSDENGIAVDKPFSMSDVTYILKKYGFFIILAFCMLIFFWLVQRAKKFE